MEGQVRKRVRVRLKAENPTGLYESFGQRVSEGGVFLKMKPVIPVGTKVAIELSYKSGEVALKGRGEVASVQSADTSETGLDFQLVWSDDSEALVQWLLDEQKRKHEVRDDSPGLLENDEQGLLSEDVVDAATSGDVDFGQAHHAVDDALNAASTTEAEEVAEIPSSVDLVVQASRKKSPKVEEAAVYNASHVGPEKVMTGEDVLGDPAGTPLARIGALPGDGQVSADLAQIGKKRGLFARFFAWLGRLFGGNG